MYVCIALVQKSGFVNKFLPMRETGERYHNKFTQNQVEYGSGGFGMSGPLP
jgi:hypothetical protein